MLEGCHRSRRSEALARRKTGLQLGEGTGGTSVINLNAKTTAVTYAQYDNYCTVGCSFALSI